MTDIELKRGEGRRIPFNLTYTGSADLSSATITFKVKYKKSDTTAIITKNDSDIDKTEIDDDVIYITLSTTDTDIVPKQYIAELKFSWTENSTYKTRDIDFYINEAVN